MECPIQDMVTSLSSHNSGDGLNSVGRASIASRFELRRKIGGTSSVPIEAVNSLLRNFLRFKLVHA